VGQSGSCIEHSLLILALRLRNGWANPAMLVVGGAALLIGLVGCSESGAQVARPASKSESLKVVATRVDPSTSSIGPAPGTPLAQVERDAGVSARLRDGSVVWFFGDTAVRFPSGALRFFAVGSAAWSLPGEPAVTRDYVENGEAVPFSEVQPSDFSCPTEAPTAGRWPLSAVVDSTGATDRVVLWMGNVCLGGGQAIDRGVAVGEWIYDPAQPPIGRPITVKLLNPRLFSDNAAGDAAFLDPDGRVYTYGCGGAGFTDGLSRRQRPCRVSRVGFADIGNAANYEFWDGRRWSVNEKGKPMAFQPGANGSSNPQGAFSAMWDEERRAYLMAYSPWPGFVPLGAIRVANSPQGPWSAPAEFDLPECSDGLTEPERACYGVNFQPDFSVNGRVGIGYSDRRVESAMNRGAFLVTTIGLTVSGRRTGR